MVTKAPGFPYVFRFVNTILASWKLRDKYLRLWKTRDMLLKSLRRAIRARSIFKRRHIWDIMWGARRFTFQNAQTAQSPSNTWLILKLPQTG